MTTGKCMECKKDFYLNSGDNHCRNIENCFESTFGICKICSKGYYLDKKEINVQNKINHFMVVKKLQMGKFAMHVKMIFFLMVIKNVHITIFVKKVEVLVKNVLKDIIFKNMIKFVQLKNIVFMANKVQVYVLNAKIIIIQNQKPANAFQTKKKMISKIVDYQKILNVFNVFMVFILEMIINAQLHKIVTFQKKENILNVQIIIFWAQIIYVILIIVFIQIIMNAQNVKMR